MAMYTTAAQEIHDNIGILKVFRCYPVMHTFYYFYSRISHLQIEKILLETFTDIIPDPCGAAGFT